MASILIGTSGYDYPEWQGSFYPPEVKRKDFLGFYSTVFNALELNNTFYSMPTASRMESFVQKSGGKISLSVKANRLLTHEVTADWKYDASIFLEALSPVIDKNLLGSVLFQFPQSFHYTRGNRFFLSHLLSQFEGFPVVVEFRHAEWLKESVFDGLIRRKCSVVFCDMPQLKALPNAQTSPELYSQFIGPQAYIRLHGRNAASWYVNDSSPNGSSRYDYDYSDEELMEFVPVIHVASEENRKVQIFFNNHPKGHGASNAKTLMELLKKKQDW